MSTRETSGAIPKSIDIFSENRETKGYSVNEIPLLLYEELSHHLTLGEETEIHIENKKYRLKKLDPSHKATGFPGAIGIEKSYDHVRFVLWFRTPSGTESVFEPDPILKIDAGPKDQGVWATGKGKFIKESILVKFPWIGITLESESIKLISLILYRASELTRNPECIKDSYWENDRFSEG